MGRLKRRLVTIQETKSTYKVKRRKTEETVVRGETGVKAGENKEILKTTTDCEDKLTHETKAQDIPNNLETRPIDDITNDNSTEPTTTCSQIPEFTDNDLDELISYSDLDLFTGNQNFDMALATAIDTIGTSISIPDLPYDFTQLWNSNRSNNCTASSTPIPELPPMFKSGLKNDCTASSTTNPQFAPLWKSSVSNNSTAASSTSIPDFPQFLMSDVKNNSTLDLIDKATSEAMHLYEDLEGPLDLSINCNFESSPPTQQRTEPSSLLSSRIDSYIDKMRCRHDFLLAHSTTNTAYGAANNEKISLPHSVGNSAYATANKQKISLAHSARDSAYGTANEQKISMDDKGCSTYGAMTGFHAKTINNNGNVETHQNTIKPPSAVLAELLRLQGTKPNYDFKQICGAPKPVFQCLVWFSINNAYGSGMSKGEAKEAASSSLLEKLFNNKYFGNCIGRLQEFTTSQNWPLPIYTDEIEVRARKVNGFIVSCSVRQHKEFGHGKSKKMAKLFAAYKMLHSLRNW